MFRPQIQKTRVLGYLAIINMFLVYLEYIFLLIWVIIEVLVPKWQKAS